MITLAHGPLVFGNTPGGKSSGDTVSMARSSSSCLANRLGLVPAWMSTGRRFMVNPAAPGCGAPERSCSTHTASVAEAANRAWPHDQVTSVATVTFVSSAIDSSRLTKAVPRLWLAGEESRSASGNPIAAATGLENRVSASAIPSAVGGCQRASVSCSE